MPMQYSNTPGCLSYPRTCPDRCGFSNFMGAGKWSRSCSYRLLSNEATGPYPLVGGGVFTSVEPYTLNIQLLALQLDCGCCVHMGELLGVVLLILQVDIHCPMSAAGCLVRCSLLGGQALRCHVGKPNLRARSKKCWSTGGEGSARHWTVSMHTRCGIQA